MVLSACGRRARVSIPSSSSGELEGIASYYAEPYHGRRTANGEVFDTYDELTAAHRTLPFNTVVRVKNEKNGREVDVRINDRGPFIEGRVIDLSLRAARQVDMVRDGIVPVKLRILKEGDGARIRVTAGGAPSAYAVQVGSFESRRMAEDLKSRLDRKFDRVSIQTASGERTMYRVRVGRESDLKSAEQLASKLRSENLDTLVIRVE